MRAVSDEALEREAERIKADLAEGPATGACRLAVRYLMRHCHGYVSLNGQEYELRTKMVWPGEYYIARHAVSAEGQEENTK